MTILFARRCFFFYSVWSLFSVLVYVGRGGANISYRDSIFLYLCLLVPRGGSRITNYIFGKSWWSSSVGRNGENKVNIESGSVPADAASLDVGHSVVY